LQAFFSQNAPVAPAASCLPAPNAISHSANAEAHSANAVPLPLVNTVPFCKIHTFLQKKLPFTHFLLASLLILRYIKECFIKFM